MTRAIVQSSYGGREVLAMSDVDIGKPGPGQLHIRHRAIGVNFHDIYVRTGLYRTLQVPGTPGIEAVGDIVAVGDDVSAWKVGQRVAYVDGTYGAYAEERLISQNLLLAAPDDISDELLASHLVRGLTAAVLLTDVYALKAKNTFVVHAAAGGMGRILSSWATSIGAQVVGTVGSADKIPAAQANCKTVLLYTDAAWPQQAVSALGRSADYVCDSIGGPTFDGSLEVASSCGHIAVFGQSGGEIKNFAISALARKSLTVSRPILFHYYAKPEKRAVLWKDFIDAVRKGGVVLTPPIVLPLEQAGEAQSMLEERRAPSSIVLKP